MLMLLKKKDTADKFTKFMENLASKIMAKNEKYKEKSLEDIHLISIDDIDKSIDKHLEVKSLYNDHSLEEIQEYKDIIVIGEWVILDESVERYVSLKFIFDNKYNDGELQLMDRL